MCRQQSLEKLDEFNGRITVIAGATDDPEVIKRAVAGCGVVLAPSQWPCHTHSTSLFRIVGGTLRPQASDFVQSHG